MTEPRLLIFDWDGTLIDSIPDIIQAMKNTGAEKGLQIPTNDQIKNIIGLSLTLAVKTLFPNLGPRDIESITRCYRKHYKSIRISKNALFPGVKQLLTGLRDEDFYLAIATGKSRNGLRESLRETGLSHFFHACRCSDETLSKPNPTMIFELLDELNVSTSAAIMIGDSVHDLKMAKSASIASIGVTYGAHPMQQLIEYEPLACADEVMEINRYIKQYFPNVL